MPSERIHLLDTARGVCVLLMICHHFLYDLVTFMDAPLWFFYNPAFMILEPMVAGIFILISGIASRFSRSNVKRGLAVLAAALLLTVVTMVIDNPIRFGILHFLGVCMVLYGLTHKTWEGLRGKAFPICCCVLTVASAAVINMANPVQCEYLWFFGLYTESFFSADYFPLFPWIFVFLLGTWLGAVIKEKRLPEWFYKTKPGFFSKVGGKAFIIYLLHQPVLMGIVLLLKRLVK